MSALLALALSVMLASCDASTQTAATPAASPAVGQIPGLFSEARAREPDRTIEPPAVPASPFPEWAGSVVVYDTANGTARDLGPGMLGSFSPDAKRCAWAAGGTQSEHGTISVLTLATGEVRTYGSGSVPFFTDDEHVAFSLPESSDVVIADLSTGTTTPSRGTVANDARAALSSARRETTPDGYRVTRPSADRPFQVLDPNGAELFEFDAIDARPAGAAQIVIVTRPVRGMSNIFLVSLPSGVSKFVASANAEVMVAANNHFVAWIGDYCGSPEQQGLFVLDLDKDVLTKITASGTRWGMLAMTPAGKLALGDFGAFALLDPGTLQYSLVLPEPVEAWRTGSGGDIAWSADYRYASRGPAPAHGGVC